MLIVIPIRRCTADHDVESSRTFADLRIFQGHKFRLHQFAIGGTLQSTSCARTRKSPTAIEFFRGMGRDRVTLLCRIGCHGHARKGLSQRTRLRRGHVFHARDMATRKDPFRANGRRRRDHGTQDHAQHNKASHARGCPCYEMLSNGSLSTIV